MISNSGYRVVIVNSVNILKEALQLRLLELSESIQLSSDPPCLGLQ